MAGYDYNYRSGYSTGNPVGPYTTTGYSSTSFPPNVEPMRNSNYGYAADGFPPRVYSESSHVGPFNGVNMPQQPYQTGYTGAPGYGDQYSEDSRHYGRYEDDFIRKPHDDRYNRKPDAGLLGQAINMASQGGNKRKTSRSAWGSSGLPVRGDGRLGVPTDDMERALHYLRESAKSRQ